MRRSELKCSFFECSLLNFKSRDARSSVCRVIVSVNEFSPFLSHFVVAATRPASRNSYIMSMSDKCSVCGEERLLNAHGGFTCACRTDEFGKPSPYDPSKCHYCGKSGIPLKKSAGLMRYCDDCGSGGSGKCHFCGVDLPHGGKFSGCAQCCFQCDRLKKHLNYEYLLK